MITSAEGELCSFGSHAISRYLTLFHAISRYLTAGNARERSRIGVVATFTSLCEVCWSLKLICISWQCFEGLWIVS